MDGQSGVQSRRVKFMKHSRDDFMQVLQVEMDRARRYDRRLTLSMAVARPADAVSRQLWACQQSPILSAFALSAGRELRSCDFFARVSDGAIAVALPETDADTARIALERICVGCNAAKIGATVKGFACASSALSARFTTAQDWVGAVSGLADELSDEELTPPPSGEL